MPPQFYILSTLADILDGAINTAEQRGKLQALSAGAFGKFIFNPRKIGWDEDGRLILALEGDETSGIRKGRLHRVIAKMHTGVSVPHLRKGMATIDISLQDPHRVCVSPKF